MKHRITKLCFFAGLLLFFVFSSVAGLLAPYFTPAKAAAAAPQYTFYYPDNDKARSDLIGAAEDGGIGDTDTGGVLGQTAIITKGGPLGTAILPLNADYSNKNDIPTYSVDYYCSPTNGYKLSLEEPSGSDPYVRLTYGVTIMDNGEFKGIVDDASYPTYVGVLGDTNVGSVHFPSRSDGETATIPAADFDLPGAGGDHDVRTGFDKNDYFRQDGARPLAYSFKSYDSSLAADPISVFDKCKPNPVGSVGNATTNYNKLSKSEQESWDKAVKQAGYGDNVGKAIDTALGGDSPDLECDAKFLDPLSWIACPLVDGLSTLITGLDDQINSQLSVGSPGNSSNPNQIFCDGRTAADSVQNCQAYHKAWASFRNIALGLMAIAALVIIISEMGGFEFFDAYTLRKVLPRLVVAALAITLSWQLMQFFVTFSNALGYGVRFLIYQPFVSIPDFNTAVLGGGGKAVLGLLAIGAFIPLGVMGYLSFIASGALAVLVAFLVLMVRQMVIIALVIVAPVAIVMYILPNTNNMYRLWWDSFAKALMMFPIIAAFIAVGRVFAVISANSNAGSISQLLGFAAYFAPYFLIPLTFRLAGGAISTIGGLVNDRSRGAFDGLRNFRRNQSKDRIQRAQAGKLWNQEYGRFRAFGKERSVGSMASKAAMWASAPHQNIGYELGKRGTPGFKRYHAGVASFLAGSEVEQSEKLLQKLNSTGMFNDKAYRALAGAYTGFNAGTQERLQAAGFMDNDGNTLRAPRSLKDIDTMSSILSQSSSETEQKAALALQGSRGTLTHLTEDSETMRANPQAAGIMGLAAHGFADDKDLANVANQMIATSGMSTAQQVADKAAVMGQAQRPDIKAGYGLLVAAGGKAFKPVTRDSERTRALLGTIKQQDWMGAKSLAIGNLSPHIEAMAKEVDGDGNLTTDAKAMRQHIALGASQFSSSDVNAKVEWQKLADNLSVDVAAFDQARANNVHRGDATAGEDGGDGGGGDAGGGGGGGE